MSTTAWLILAGFALVCVRAYVYLRRNPTKRGPDDDMGATPRDQEGE